MHTITTGYLNDRPPSNPNAAAHRGAYDKVGGALYTAIRASVLSRRREVAHQPQHGDVALPDQRASVRGRIRLAYSMLLSVSGGPRRCEGTQP